jgi:hypothetical protein
MVKEAAAEQPDNPIVLLALARANLADRTAQGLAQATLELSRVIASGSATASSYELYGYALERSGEIAAAIAALKSGIAAFPFSSICTSALL